MVAGTFVTAQGGSIVIAADGSYTYTPPADFHGTDTVDYTVTDGSLTDTATLTLTVTPVNDAVTFTPDADFNGVATFSYTVTDGNLVSNTATVTVNVAPVNDAPLANDDSLAATEDTPVTFAAADAQAVAVHVAVVAQQVCGTEGHRGVLGRRQAVVVGHRRVVHRRDRQGQGRGVGQAAVGDGVGLAATEDTPVTFAAADLLGNDSDVDGDSLSIASVTSGTGGTAVLNADGTVTFTPDADFNGVAVAVDVAVVGQQADAGAERHVLADGDRIVLGHRGVVHRSHVDRDGGGVGDQVAVGHRVAEGTGVTVRVRVAVSVRLPSVTV
ncbi:tandem-95 repeat protein [Pseudomonas stutzeri]|nr:tandem-95 repeat protein [Stutzerimonas stutzeri]